jgi:hypothetical protein
MLVIKRRSSPLVSRRGRGTVAIDVADVFDDIPDLYKFAMQQQLFALRRDE